MIKTPNCYTRACVNYLGIKNDGDETTERVYCKAFTDTIPTNIAFGRNKHLKPLPKQKNKIIFEEKEEKTPQLKALEKKEELKKSLEADQVKQKALKAKRKRQKKRKKSRK